MSHKEKKLMAKKAVPPRKAKPGEKYGDMTEFQGKTKPVKKAAKKAPAKKGGK